MPSSDYRHHVQMSWTGRDHSDSVLLIGTSEEIEGRVSASISNALRFGSVKEITLRPIHPANVQNLTKE